MRDRTAKSWDSAARGSVGTLAKPQKAVDTAARFTRLVSRTVSFSDRLTRHAVVYVLDDDGGLVLRINKAFMKRVQVLRIHSASAVVLDQDDYVISVPYHQFARCEARLRDLSRCAGVPAFTIVGDHLASCSHSAATRDLTFVTLDMVGGTGSLTVSWSRPSGGMIEKLELWSPTRASCALCRSVFRAFPLAQQQLRVAAAWAASRSAGVFVIVEASSVEGQALAHEAWPELCSTNRAAIFLVPPALPESAASASHGGAASGYSTAITLEKILEDHFDAKDGPLQMAFVDVNLARSNSIAFDVLLPVLREQLHRVPLAGAALSFPRDTLENAQKFIAQIHSAYVEALQADMSRPYVHSLVGDGALEAEVSEAVETVARRLNELHRCVGSIATQNSFLARMELVLPSTEASQFVQPRQMGKLARKVLVPIGNLAGTLAQLVQTCLSDQWCIETSGWQNDCLAVIDLTDTQAVSWLRQAQRRAESEAGPWSVHVLLLLPGCSASQSSLEAAAEPLALLTCGSEDGGDILDFGLALVASLDCVAQGSQQLLPIFDALANARLQDIAFQLRPNPRAGLCVIAYATFEGDALTTLTGEMVESREVLASFSFWNTSGETNADCQAAHRGLLPPRFFTKDITAAALALPLSVGRAGMVYESSLPPTARKGALLPMVDGSMHLCACSSAEAALYRRIAGDFKGREESKFEWQGDPTGPQARLWHLASELCQSLGNDRGGTLSPRSFAAESQPSSARCFPNSCKGTDSSSHTESDSREGSHSGSLHADSLQLRLEASPIAPSPRRSEITEQESGGYSDDEFLPEA